MAIETLKTGSRRYRLRDSGMSNAAIAKHLDLQNDARGQLGFPTACFYQYGVVVGVRADVDQVAIFHLFESIQTKMAGIADEMNDGR